MSKVFTKEGAARLHNEFRELCKQFADKNGITFERSNLTYGEQLNFGVLFGIEENKNDEWVSWVRWFNGQGVELKKGMSFNEGKKVYTVTGKLNPSQTSRFQIGVINETNGKEVYFDATGLVKLLKGEQ